jgi:hypothetical protein
LVAEAAGSADGAGAGATAGAGVGGVAADAVADGGGRTAAVTGFFFFAAGLRADGAAAGCNCTKTGFGASFDVAPSASRTDTVCGWYPLSASVTDNSPPGWTVS